MSPFIGRKDQLAILAEELRRVRESGRGRFLSIRGRRRVGKSRLVQHFVERERAPYVFYQAPRRSPREALRRFAATFAESSLPGAGVVREGLVFESWEAALRLVGESATAAAPAVVVIDELPYLLERDPGLDADLQNVWDNHLQDKPVLLVVIGSDVSMMKALTEYGSALHGRPTREMVVPPFSPKETADLLGLNAAAALDSYLVVGGFPLIAGSWRRGLSLRRFLAEALADPTSPLIVNGERILAAEFERELQAREVLATIGHGERTFTNILHASGLAAAALDRSLKVLVGKKRVVSAARPLSARPTRDPRYMVADPYLRFWLRFIEPNLDEIERGRSDLVVERIERSWPDYRGRAIEPLVRESLTRLLPAAEYGDARHVGGYWTRKHDVEVDLVGAPDRERPKRVSFVGSIKWRERAPFRRRDLIELMELRPRVPGMDGATFLVGVSRSGFDVDGLDIALGPDELISAWPG